MWFQLIELQVNFKCCFFLSLFNKTVKIRVFHINTGCLFFVPFLLIYLCLLWFISLCSLILTCAASRNNSVDITCLPARGPQRRAGSVEQVLLSSRSWSSGSSAAWLATDAVPSHPKQMFVFFVQQLLFTFIPLVKALNASFCLVYLLAGSWSTETGVGTGVALVLKFSKLWSNVELVQNILGFFSMVLKRIQAGLKVEDVWKSFLGARCRSAPQTSEAVRSSPQALLREPVDPQRQTRLPPWPPITNQDKVQGSHQH